MISVIIKEHYCLPYKAQNLKVNEVQLYFNNNLRVDTNQM